jgi:hypothetical protein
MAEALRGIFAKFGVDFDDAELNRGKASIDRTKESLVKLGKTIAAGFAFEGIASFVGETVRLGNEIRKAADQIGATTDEIQSLDFVFQSVGLNTDDVADALGTLQEKAMDAADGTDSAVDAFKKLGVEYKNSSGELKSGVELFEEVADGLMRLENDSERTGIALTLLEDPGRRLVPIMKNGSEGIRQLRNEVGELGGGAGPQFFEAIRGMSRATNRLSIVTTGLRTRFVTALLPTIVKATEALAKAGAAIIDVADKSNILQIAIGILGGAFVIMGIKAAAAFAGPLAVMGLAAAAIAVVALAVDDLIVTFQGGESVIQGVLDELFGFGTTALVVKAVTLAWEDFVGAIERAIVAVRSFLEPFGLLQEAGFARTQRAARAIEGEERLTGGRFFRERRGARDVAGEETLDPTRRAQLFGRGVRQGVTPTTFAEMAEAAGMSGQRARGVQGVRAAAARGQGAVLEGDIRSGAPVIGEGGRIIAREAPSVARGGSPVTVGDSTLNLTINAAEASAVDVARIAQRELEITLARQRRQTIAAIGGEAES